MQTFSKEPPQGRTFSSVPIRDSKFSLDLFRYGACLSLRFLDSSTEYIRAASARAKRGIQFDGDWLSTLAYADDIALMAYTNDNMQKQVDMLSKFMNYYGLTIGIDKSTNQKATMRKSA
jgi:hypothetical protein